MSLIYAGGSKATAIANITSEINSCISTHPDGTKWLDNQALVVWARAQLAQMITDLEATAADYVGGQDPTSAALALANVINPPHWQGRSDWPVDTATLSAAARISAVRAQQGVCKAASDAVTAYYANTADKVESAIDDYLDGNIVPNVDAGVALIEEDRAYIATYVTDREEESAPSPATALVALDQNDTVNVTVAAPPTGRNITHFRLYRTNTTNTSAAFQYVPNPADDDGWPIGTLTITDSAKDAELQEPCPSLLWDEPPSNLQGLVGGANGGMAGFRNNEFCPCLPYVPYAFPASLRITTESPIVGLAASGQTYFVGTRGRPSLISGADTQSLSQTKLEDEQACVAKRSIVAAAGGFLYASPDGVCFATASGVKVITGPASFNLFDRDTWQALKPDSIIAAENEGAYVFKWDNGTTHGVYSLDLQTGRLVTLSNDGSALFRDAITDRLYIAQGTAIKALFADTTKRTAIWKSKRITLAAPQSFAWLQAEGTYGTITVKVYMDGTLVRTAALTSRDPVRMPPGESDDWEVQVESAARVTSLTLATSTEELNKL